VQTLNIASVSVGVGLFVIALILFVRTRRLAGGRRGWWTVLGLFVLGFLGGYGVWLVLLITDRELVAPQLLVSQVFLWGAVFVVFTARLFERTVASQIEAIDGRRKAEVERLEMERSVQDAQRLESLGVLAGGIAHDFNNLLVGMLGHASRARDLLEDGSAAQDSLAQVETSARRAAELTRQLLAYSGKGRFVVEPLDLGALVREMAQLVDVTVSKKARLTLDLAPGLPPVEGDAVQLRQVVLNLITNASDAVGQGGGMIGIRSGAVDADEGYLQGPWLPSRVPVGAYVVLEVSDDGCGIEPETLVRMFEPFHSTKGAGRGLGLSAVLGIVRGHHGALRVYSEIGRGTTIKVLLPVASAHAVERSGPHRRPPAAAGRGGIILLADDEPTVRDLGRAILERGGYEVLTVPDGLAAVEAVEARGAELGLLILDMTMPRLGGAEALEQIRCIRPDIPAILSSGYNEQDVTSRFASDGLAGFLPKPWTAGDLLEAVRGVLGGTDDDG